MQRAQLLRQLVLESHYVIDEHLIAAAILARSATRRLVAEGGFRNDTRPATVRSFRPSAQARSFRPCTQRSSVGRRRAAWQAGLI